MAVRKWVVYGVLLLAVIISQTILATEDVPGTGTPGYWKNHPEAWIHFNGSPILFIGIGDVVYTRDAAIDSMNSNGPRGPKDKTYDLFYQMVAARLNILVGNEYYCVKDIYWEAYDWMVHYPLGSGVRANSPAWQTEYFNSQYHGLLSIAEMHDILDDYNNGLLCALSRDVVEQQNNNAKPAVAGSVPFTLDQNVPNPFNPVTTIKFSIPQETRVVLSIFNVAGTLVATLADDTYSAGEHVISWDAGDYPSGVYFYRIQAGAHMTTRKLMLLR